MASCFMIIFAILHFSQLFEHARGEVQYYISKDKSTWINASRTCALGTPSVNLNLSLDIPNQDITEDLWIGYHLVTLKFEFVGCTRKEQGFELSVYNGRGLSRCFSSCDSAPYFGLSNTSCFCFDKMPQNISEDLVCGRQCRRSSCNACKGDDYMTFYKLYSNGNKNDSANFAKITILYTWFNEMCQPGSNQIVTPKGKHVVETTYAVVKYNKYSTATIMTRPSFGYVEIRKSNDQKVLNFKISSDQLRAFCVREIEASTPEEDQLGVYVGITLVLTVGIIVLVTAVVILKRRRNEAIRNGDDQNTRCEETIGTEHAYDADECSNEPSKQELDEHAKVGDKSKGRNSTQKEDYESDSMDADFTSSSDEAKEEKYVNYLTVIMKKWKKNFRNRYKHTEQ